MLRQFCGFFIRRPLFRKAVMTLPGISQLAWRFVAGEDLDAGVSVIRDLNARGVKGSLNFVGTHVLNKSEAIAATDAAIETLRRIHDEGLDSNISIKPTQIGLDIDMEFCREQHRRVLECARAVGGFVRIDMEESWYVEPTLVLFEELREEFGLDTVGIVIQSYLRERASDLNRVVSGGSSVRLVKGGYWEAASVTYRDKADIDRCFDRDIQLLLARGRSPAIATHDEKFIARTKAIASEVGIDRSQFEFQMLYGVRQDIQDQLVSEGYNVRCYVPYGGQWFAYFLGCVRRLPEGLLRRWQGRS